MSLPIQDMHFVFNFETEESFYFTDQMLQANTFIFSSTFESEDIPLGQFGCIESFIEVACLNDDQTYAGRYVLFWGPLLNSIEEYRIVKDIQEIFMDNHKDNFIKAMKDLSSQYYDSDLNERDDLIGKIHEDINFLKLELKGEQE